MPLHESIGRAQTFARDIVLRRPTRVGRSLALIASASCVGALDGLEIHDVRSAEEKDGMSQAEMRSNHGLQRTRHDAVVGNPRAPCAGSLSWTLGGSPGVMKQP